MKIQPSVPNINSKLDLHVRISEFSTAPAYVPTINIRVHSSTGNFQIGKSILYIGRKEKEAQIIFPKKLITTARYVRTSRLGKLWTTLELAISSIVYSHIIYDEDCIFT